MSNNYATTTQLETFALPSNVLTTLSTGVAQVHLDAAAAWLDGVIAARYPSASLPLSSVSLEVTQCVCEKAAFSILHKMQFDTPADGSSYEKRAEQLTAWAERIAAGLVTLAGSSPAATTQPRVYSRAALGWHDETTDDE